MPAQKTISKFAQKTMAASSAVKKHAADETKYGFQELPPGLKAVARLMECGFVEVEKDTKMKTASGQSAAGQFRFQAMAVIDSPEYFTDDKGTKHKVKGRQVWKFIPFYDTKTASGKVTTVDNHTATILNEMRKLGGDDYTADAETTADLENLALGLQEGKPFFCFSTSFKAGGPKPGGGNYPDGVWENWDGIRGLDENYQSDSGDAAGGTEDSSGDADGGDVDLDSLVEAATGGDEDAQKKLNELALEAGADQDAIDNAADWAEVRGMIEGGGSGDAKDDAPPAEPAKGDTCRFSPPDPKNPKKRLKEGDYSIDAVDKKSKTVSLTSLVDAKKKYTKVSWDDITLA